MPHSAGLLRALRGSILCELNRPTNAGGPSIMRLVSCGVEGMRPRGLEVIS